MADTLIYVRRSYVKDGAPDISDKDQIAGVAAHLASGERYEVIADSYDENDPTSKRKHSGASTARDGYRELIRRVQAGGIKRVGVYDLSRLNRDTREMLNLKHELDRQGVHLLVANMPGSDFDTAAGRFQFGVMCMAAQYQRDLDSEKGKRRAEQVFHSGGHNGLDPLGYQTVRDEKGRVVHPRRLAIVEAEAVVVRRVFADLAHKSFVDTARDLNADAVPNRTGTPWTVDGVKDVWRRRRFYLGFAVWKRGLDERPGTHPAILDDAAYRAAEIGVASRRRAGRAARPHRTYILSGIASCSCGAQMRGTATLNRGTEWRYYRCGGRCGQPSAKAEAVEQAVIDAVRGKALPERAIERAWVELARRLKTPMGSLSDKKRQRLTHALEALKKQHLWGDISDADYRSQKAELEQALAETPDSDKLVLFEQHRRVVTSLADNIDRATPTQIKELVAILVERVPIVSGNVDADAIEWTPAARPFFDGRYWTEAPPEGFEGLPVQSDPLAWYAVG